MACPSIGALGEVEVMVVVAAGFTVWLTPVEALEAKSASPLKVAVNVSAAAALGASEHVPALTVAVQLGPVLSVTVTVSLPGIVPVPGELTATVKLTDTGCPTTEGLGVLAVILVAVGAKFTF
jgi:hypothetical protein